MKLTKHSNLSFYNKLNDKSIDLSERLKLAKNSWDLKETQNFNKNQLIIEWIVDLITSKRNNFAETELLNFWDRLNFFLEEYDNEKNPINNGQIFAQCLIETLSNSSGIQRDLALNCCSKLLNTKFSHYFTRNFDQMLKILIKFTFDIKERIKNIGSEIHRIDSFIERSVLVFNKFLFCLKTQQNLNRLFNKICTQVLFSLLNLIDQIDKLECEKFSVLKDLAWKILKYGLISNSHSNLYFEFFKNLPNSFTLKSNYQVAILFSTIKNESFKSLENMSSLSKYIGYITKELFSILLNLDYKLKISIIQFICDLVYNLEPSLENEKMEIDNELIDTQDFIEKKMNALANLIQLVDEINLFNPLEDENNDNIFKQWSKTFINKVLLQKKNLTKFLIAFLKTDHLILEDNLEIILDILKDDCKLDEFLNFYIDSNIKYRQLSRATLKLVDCIEKNKMQFPLIFYKHYSSCLEGYLVDSHTFIDIWSDLLKILNENSKIKKTESLKFLKCIISRINLCTPSVPNGLRASALKLLSDTNEILLNFLLNCRKFNDEMANLMDCFYTSGLLCILLYRFSSETVVKIAQSNSEVSINDLNDNFFKSLNEKFALNKKIKDEIENLKSEKENFSKIFLLNKLQLLNVYRMNLTEIAQNDLTLLEETILNSKLLIENSFENRKVENLIENFSIESKIDSLENLTYLHGKYILLDNLYLLIPLFKHKKDIMETIFTVVFRLILNFESIKTYKFVDEININTIFNDIDLIKPIFISLLNALKDMDLNKKMNGSKNHKHCLDLIIDFVENNFDSKLKIEIVKAKNIDKYEFNKNQTEFILKISDLIPLEYLEPNYALVYNLLIELVKIDNRLIQEQCLALYNRLISSNLTPVLPCEKLESWLINWFTLFQNLELTDIAKDQFKKIFKKCLYHLMKEQNIDVYSSFLFSLNDKLKIEKSQNLNFLINVSFLYTFEKIGKILDFNSTIEPNFSKKLKILDQTIFNFISKQKFSDDEEIFLACSVMINSMLSSGFKNDINREKKLQYFGTIVENCLGQHKNYSKKIKNQISNLKIGSFYFDFLNNLITNTEKLSKLCQINVDKVKLVKQLYKFYQRYDLSCQFDEDHIGKSLRTTFFQSVNTFNSEEFKEILDHIDTCLNENLESKAITDLVKISQLIKFMANDVELNENLKQDFAEYLQKFVIKTPSIILSLKLNNQLNELIDMMSSNIGIIAPKYFLLPSHLVISSLQIYVSISYDKLKIEDYVRIQELACKTVNIILTRYSKKFTKLADIICNLLIKLICTTTSFSNQNILTNTKLNLAIKAAQDLDRIVSQLTSFKKDFSKISPYMISEYVYKANTIPVHLSVKRILLNMMFNLISICDMHAISQLHVVLANGPKELFKNIYQEYEKYFKYTGKV